MRILVTGSSGQLGSTVSACLSQHHQVIGVDAAPGKYTHQVGSVADRDFVLPLVKGVEAIIHTASLHARHLQSHTKSQFVDTNVHGTLNLLEAAVENGVRRFVYTSTTSLYGSAMVSADRAVWVTEDLQPSPRDVYDVTKIAAEGLCQIISSQYGLPCISLRVSRFFQEAENLMAIYRLYRGVDVRDATEAHLLALQSDLPGYEVFNISAHSPFTKDESIELFENAREVILRRYPSAAEAFARRRWSLPERIDRVYVTEKAERLLGYQPRYNFGEVMSRSVRSEEGIGQM